MNTEAIEQRKRNLINQMNTEQARANQLQAELQGLQRNIIGVEGALLDCDFWLDEITKQEQETNGRNMDIAKETPGTNGKDGKDDRIDAVKSGGNNEIVNEVLAAAEKKAKSKA